MQKYTECSLLSTVLLGLAEHPYLMKKQRRKHARDYNENLFAYKTKKEFLSNKTK